jgi:hypothetical protein
MKSSRVIGLLAAVLLRRGEERRPGGGGGGGAENGGFRQLGCIPPMLPESFAIRRDRPAPWTV